MTAEMTPENVERLDLGEERYDNHGMLTSFLCMVRNAAGEYVRYSDFATLAEKCRRLEEELRVWRRAAQQAVAERNAAVKYREAVFDGNAVFMALAKTSHAACSISALQVIEVLDAVNRVAISGEPK